jgi:hypothetical protein
LRLIRRGALTAALAISFDYRFDAELKARARYELAAELPQIQ